MRQARRGLRPSPFLRALGATIRFRREQLHLTIVQVAQRAGTTPQALAGVERGSSNLSLLQLQALAGALEIPLPQLLSLAEQHLVQRLRR
jgi:transcriptional regulator with XRE-family HTH domain